MPYIAPPSMFWMYCLISGCQLEVIVKKSMSQIMRDVKAGTFPAPVKLGRKNAWLFTEVLEWMMVQLTKEAKILVQEEIAGILRHDPQMKPLHMVTMAELIRVIPLSAHHICRLSKSGKFPQKTKRKGGARVYWELIALERFVQNLIDIRDRRNERSEAA